MKCWTRDVRLIVPALVLSSCVTLDIDSKPVHFEGTAEQRVLRVGFFPAVDPKFGTSTVLSDFGKTLIFQVVFIGLGNVIGPLVHWTNSWRWREEDPEGANCYAMLIGYCKDVYEWTRVAPEEEP